MPISLKTVSDFTRKKKKQELEIKSLTNQKDESVYEDIDISEVLDIYRHYIIEWNLHSRYIDQHEDRFIAQAVQDSAYISHPVPFTAQDFQSIFDDILSDSED